MGDKESESKMRTKKGVRTIDFLVPYQQSKNVALVSVSAYLQWELDFSLFCEFVNTSQTMTCEKCTINGKVLTCGLFLIVVSGTVVQQTIKSFKIELRRPVKQTNNISGRRYLAFGVVFMKPKLNYTPVIKNLKTLPSFG